MRGVVCAQSVSVSVRDASFFYVGRSVSRNDVLLYDSSSEVGGGRGASLTLSVGKLSGALPAEADWKHPHLSNDSSREQVSCAASPSAMHETYRAEVDQAVSSRKHSCYGVFNNDRPVGGPGEPADASSDHSFLHISRPSSPREEDGPAGAAPGRFFEEDGLASATPTPTPTHAARTPPTCYTTSHDLSWIWLGPSRARLCAREGGPGAWRLGARRDPISCSAPSPLLGARYTWTHAGARVEPADV